MSAKPTARFAGATRRQEERSPGLWSGGLQHGSPGDMSERRKAERVPYIADVQCEDVTSGTTCVSARVSDISMTGVFVDARWAFPAGTRLRVEFDLPSLRMNVLTEVANSMPPHGMGLRFERLTDTQRVAVEEVVGPAAVPEERAADAAGSGREATTEPAPEPERAPERSSLSAGAAVESEPAANEAAEALATPTEEGPAPSEETAATPSGEVEHEPSSGGEIEPSADATPAETIPTAVPVAARPPTHETAAPTEPAAESEDGSGRGVAAETETGRTRVLVVDDHHHTRKMLRGMIEGRGREFTVTEASDGAEGVQLVEKGPAFHLIFMDVEMPKLDGLGACRQIRALGVKTPIIFLTGKAEATDYDAGREAGADTYIKKPIALGTLRSMLGLFTSGSLTRR